MMMHDYCTAEKKAGKMATKIEMEMEKEQEGPLKNSIWRVDVMAF